MEVGSTEPFRNRLMMDMGLFRESNQDVYIKQTLSPSRW
jgi:hypothetical protein